MEETRNIHSEEPQELAHSQIKALFDTLWQKRKVFYWVLQITFVASAILIFCVPKEYTCEVVLAPEVQNAGASGSLQAMASTLGIDMNNMANVDALYPKIYPEIIKSPDFLVTLFDIPVATVDSSFVGTFEKYLLRSYKIPFWQRWKGKIRAWIVPKEVVPKLAVNSDNGINVFCMNSAQWHVIYLMKDNITCNVDKKTDVITLKITAQDKLTCAIVGDYVGKELQAFVTEYRTRKARVDLRYYEDVMRAAQLEYQQASIDYINFIDSHSGINLEKYRVEAQNLQTEMELKRSAYTSFQKQYLATQARLQENTPVFTVLQSATIPLKASGPKRMLFVLAMLILATGITCCVLCKDQLIAMFL